MGIRLLGVWLVLYGLGQFVSLPLGPALGVLALVAGILLLVGR